MRLRDAKTRKDDSRLIIQFKKKKENIIPTDINLQHKEPVII